MSATTSLRNAMLGLITTGMYVGLLSAVTDALAGTVTEIAPASYARQAVTWGSISAGVMLNSAAILFPATSGSTTYRYIGLYTAITAGTLKFIWDTGATQNYNATTQPQIAIGDLSIDANRVT